MTPERRYLLRHIASILLLPFNALIVIPGVLISSTHDSDPGWGFKGPWAYLPILTGLGLAAGDLWLMYQAISFFRVGKGTLAPWDPPTTFVVRIYRHVRNPMISVCFWSSSGSGRARLAEHGRVVRVLVVGQPHLHARR